MILCWGDAGCAVTAGQLVGLDVEVTNRHTHGDPLRLAKRRFSPAERAALEGISALLHNSWSLLWVDSRPGRQPP